MSAPVHEPARRVRGRSVPNPERRVRNERIAGVGVVVLLALIAWLSTEAIGGGGPLQGGYEVRAELPAGAPVVRDGADVRVGGRRVGDVRRVERGGEGPLLTLALHHARVHRDAHLTARVRGLSGAVFIDLDPGTAGKELPGGSTLPAGAASTTTQVTDVLGAFDAPARTGMAAALRGYGLGLAGQGEQLAATLSDLGPAEADGASLLRALRPEPGALAELTGGFDVLARASTPRAGSLRRAVSGAGRTFAAFGDRASAIEAAVDAVPRVESRAQAALPEVDALLADAHGTLRPLAPAVASLRAALPSVARVAQRTAALDDLAALARRARPVLDSAAPLLARLRPAAGLLGPLVEPARVLAQYMAPYRSEILGGPTGFTRWGGFRYDDGQAKGARAVRFAMVLTCADRRDAYPAPGAATKERARCGG